MKWNIIMKMKKNKDEIEQVYNKEDAIPYDKITTEHIEEILMELYESAPKNKKYKYDTSIKVWQDDKHLSFQMGGILRTGLGGFIQYVSNCKEMMMMSPIIFNGVRLDKEGRKWFWDQYEQIETLYKKDE
jgi:hypothetical protein